MLSVPLRGTIFRWRSRTYPQLRSFGACSGGFVIGPPLEHREGKGMLIPLQAPKERSCGISIPLPSLGSAKRDLLSSSTSYGMLSVPLRGTIFRWRSRTYPQLRSFGACSGFRDIGPALRNQERVRGCLSHCKLRRSAAVG